MKAAIQYILGGFILAGMSGSVWGAAIMKWNENTEKTPVPATFLRPASLGEEEEIEKAWETSLDRGFLLWRQRDVKFHALRQTSQATPRAHFQPISNSEGLGFSDMPFQRKSQAILHLSFSSNSGNSIKASTRKLRFGAFSPSIVRFPSTSQERSSSWNVFLSQQASQRAAFAGILARVGDEVWLGKSYRRMPIGSQSSQEYLLAGDVAGVRKGFGVMGGTPVPEPSAIGSVGAAFLLLYGLRRKLKRSSKAKQEGEKITG